MPQETKKGITLTQTAAVMRNVIKVGGILLVFLMVGRVFLSSFIAYWKATHPEPPPPPTMGYGPLPRLEFPESNPKPAEYKLETLARATDFPDRMNVYFIPTRDANLLADERARKKASEMGYLFEPEILGASRYRWTIAEPLFSTLEMNIFTNTFTIKTNWSDHPELLTEDRLINPDTTATRVKTFLQRSSSLTPEVSSGIVETEYIKAIGGEFVPADSQSDADFLEVNLFRALIAEQYPTVTAFGKEGPVNATVTSDGTVLDMRMDLYPVELTTPETYPLRSVQEAWKVFSAGEGYVSSETPVDQAVIRQIYLAYYEPYSEQPYLQPVYVFEGDNGFIGMLEALDSTSFQARVAQ